MNTPTDIRQSFELLELTPEVTRNQTKQAYRDLVKVWHPDRFSDNDRLREKAEKKLRAFNDAYKKLILWFDSGGQALEEATEPTKQRVLSVASGKGGVGKTNFCVNIAIALSRMGEPVMILDADLGMANIDVLCGLSPIYNLEDLIRGHKSMGDVIMKVYGGVKIIPGVSGVEELTAMNPDQHRHFFRELNQYETETDTGIFLIDIGAGMSPDVIRFMIAADENIIVTTPEPTAIMDAYALIKTIARKKPDTRMQVVVNMVQNESEAMQVFSSVNRITQSFLGLELSYLGYIFKDEIVSKSVKRQKPYYLTHPHSRAGTCIRHIAEKLRHPENPVQKKSGILSFFRRMTAAFNEN